MKAVFLNLPFFAKIQNQFDKSSQFDNVTLQNIPNVTLQLNIIWSKNFNHNGDVNYDK